MKENNVIESVRAWVESFVIELNLCPFAKRELVNDKIRFVTTDSETEEELLYKLQTELGLLDSDETIETTLLIHPKVLNNFYDYNQFLNFSDRLLLEMKLDGEYQIASFHPNYQFTETEQDDVENYTNRSPYPMLHILRESSLEKAIASYNDVDQIPLRNIELMNSMGEIKLRAILHACLN